MRSRKMALVGATAAILALAGCGSSSKKTATTAPAATNAPAAAGAAQVITAGLAKDYKLNVSATTAKAGSVTFKASNSDTITHELVVLQTDLTADKLPYDSATGKAVEDTTGIANVGETGDVEAGKSKEFNVSLKPGKYLLVCNIADKGTDGTIVNHLKKGMYIAFTVS